MDSGTALKFAIDKENQTRGPDSEIPTIGTVVKRKKLSDISNTMSSSNPDPQFRKKSTRGSYVITKENVAQLMEENAAFLKALEEKNKIIGLSGIELQKLRLRTEKYSKQIRLLAQANTQMQAEHTVYKDKVRTLEHELRCTTLVLKFKNSKLDEKGKLIKELSEKLKIEEEKLIQQLDESGSIERDHLNHMEITDCDIACLSSRKRLCRSKTIGSTTSIIQPQQKPSKEHHHKINAEEIDRLKESDELTTTEDDHNKSDQVAHYDSWRSNPVVDGVSHKPSKGVLRGKSLGETAATIKLKEAKWTCARRKSSKRKAESLTSETEKYEDYFHEYEFPADSVISEPLNETVQKGENDTIKPSKKRLKSTASETQESEENFTETMNAKIQTCAPCIKSYMEIPSVIVGSTKVQNMQKAEGSSPMEKRVSVGRPSRRAAEKVSSYREIPLNIKMRRC